MDSLGGEGYHLRNRCQKKRCYCYPNDVDFPLVRFRQPLKLILSFFQPKGVELRTSEVILLLIMNNLRVVKHVVYTSLRVLTYYSVAVKILFI